MDRLLEYLYTDVMRRYWNESPSFKKAWKDWENVQGKASSLKAKDAALLLAERQGCMAFLLGLHMGLSLENDLWKRLGQEL